MKSLYVSFLRASLSNVSRVFLSMSILVIAFGLSSPFIG